MIIEMGNGQLIIGGTPMLMAEVFYIFLYIIAGFETIFFS